MATAAPVHGTWIRLSPSELKFEGLLALQSGASTGDGSPSLFPAMIES